MHFEGIELFLDNEIISWTRNIRREIQQPQRHQGNPIITGEYPWEASHATIYGSVLYDDDKELFRMWYNAYGEEYYTQQMLAYAESEDGLNWYKPMLKVRQWPGYPRTNILMGPECNLHGPGVILNPDQTNPDRRYLLMFDSYPSWRPEAGSLGIQGRCCYVAESPDGLNWSPDKGRLAIHGKADSCQSVVWDPKTKTFKAYVRGVIERDPFEQRIRYGRLVESPDFVEWGEPIELMRPDQEDGYPDIQMQQLAVTWYDGIFIGLLSLFPIVQLAPIDGENAVTTDAIKYQSKEKEIAKLPNGKETAALSRLNEGIQINDIQLITSRDGVHFSRVADRAIFMPRIEPLNWYAVGGKSHSHITTASNMLLHNDKVWIYFAEFGDEPGSPKHISVATLPRDRFVAMIPKRLSDQAVIELVPMQYPNGDLRLNALVGIAGTIQAEVSTFDGMPIEGFERENSVPIVGNSLDHKILWKRDGNEVSLDALPAELRDKPVRLRIWARQSHIFSLRDGTR